MSEGRCYGLGATLYDNDPSPKENLSAVYLPPELKERQV